MLEQGVVVVASLLFCLSACVLGTTAVRVLTASQGPTTLRVCYQYKGVSGRSTSFAGANNVALAFGPAIGAKIISYKVAAPTTVVCAALGVILFGRSSCPKALLCIIILSQLLHMCARQHVDKVCFRRKECAAVWGLPERLAIATGLS